MYRDRPEDISLFRVQTLRRCAPVRDGAPDGEHDHGSDDRSDQARTLAGAVPADRLPEKRREEGANDPQDGWGEELLPNVGDGRGQAAAAWASRLTPSMPLVKVTPRITFGNWW